MCQQDTYLMRIFALLIGMLYSVIPLTAQDSTLSIQPIDATGAAQAIRYIRKELMVPTPDAFPRGLNVLEVFADLPGPHPVALLTHGTSSKEEERMRVTPWAELAQAMWFAQRGYVVFVVVRRGYGRSGGQRDSIAGGCSRFGSFQRSGEVSADDLRAVFRYATKLPEVDPTFLISAGVSTGGFAQLALAADPPEALKGTINFAGGRGGDGQQHNCDLSGLTSAFGTFGKEARQRHIRPMLWLYAENDHWFPPTMVHQLEAAYLKQGGIEEFVLAPPDGDDGHHLYSHVAAWSATVEGFLRAERLLPLYDLVLSPPQAPDTPAPAGLHDKGLDAWKRFLLAGPHKAFATTGAGSWGSAQALFEQSAADQEAMERCKKAADVKTVCSLVAMKADE